MGAGGSIPADEAAAKEAGKTDDEIAIYKFCVGLQDGSTKAVSAEGCEFGPPGAPPESRLSHGSRVTGDGSPSRHSALGHTPYRLRLQRTRDVDCCLLMLSHSGGSAA